MKAAVLVIDMLNDFFRNEPLKGRKQDICKRINELVSIARRSRIPVVWVNQEHKKDFSDANLFMKRTKRMITAEGSHGAEILEDLQRKKSDTVITKKRYSAFFGTRLDNLIKNTGIDTLILAGIHTHACIRTTAIDAFQRDIEVIIARDCVDSWHEKHHEISMEYFEKGMGLRILTNKQIRKIL